jgi:hypothetical protein
MYVFKVKYITGKIIVLDTIVAKSLIIAVQQIRKKHPGCKILGIFDYYNY